MVERKIVGKQDKEEDRIVREEDEKPEKDFEVH